MKTTSARDPNEIMAEIRKVTFNFDSYVNTQSKFVNAEQTFYVN